MRDTLPERPLTNENAIVNLDDCSGTGSHWVAYRKTRDVVDYFDSFGNLPPPLEVREYFKNAVMRYNYPSYQDLNTVVCGHLCLLFLSRELLV